MDVASLSKVSGFNLLTQVCEEGAQVWRMADEVIEIKSYLLSPPHPNSFALDAGNAAPQWEPPPPVPIIEEVTLSEPNLDWLGSTLEAKKSDPSPEVPAVSPGPARAASSSPELELRNLCEACGFRNPRDVALCMKCGDVLKGAPPSMIVEEKATPVEARHEPPKASASMPVSQDRGRIDVSVPGAPTVDIPLPKLIALVAGLAILAGGSFLGVRSWKKRHVVPPTPVLVAPPLSPVPSRGSSTHLKAKRKRSSKASRAKAKSVVPPVALTGASAAPKTEAHTPSPELDTKTEEVPFHVIAEAAPLQRRHSAPLQSPVTTKRRAEKSLWTSQEEQAIRQVQRNRIYGGLRTMDRNTEILMQILRDREYSTAFETGKRVYLYNDLDWSASLMEGPLYEVRLSFSGGREPDGAPKRPLHFAFSADLERGSVEPGGQDQVRSNTLHAFFDESRIPPEERRPIAKDTEELVMAAQPGASPLALDTVVRQYAKLYTTAALSRVAQAYGLALVHKKLTHDPRLGSDPLSATVPSGQSAARLTEAKKVATPAKDEKAAPARAPLKGSAVDCRMETGSGRQRIFVVQATSRASPQKIWEIVTGYDHLKQFVPDMLASEREGQDGASTIVHAVYLTRFMFFVFKVNLHLRVMEHPQEHALQFERIAGDFESLRGSFQITSDPVTAESRMAFHVNLVPTGRTMNWVIEKMGRRLLVPQIEAIRTKAESL